MRNILLDTRFQLVVAAPSALWLLFWALYIAVFVGWGNLFELLPHETAIIVIGIAMPVFILAVVSFMSRTTPDSDLAADEMRRHSARIVESIQESWPFSTDDVETLKAIPKDMASAIEAQQAGIKGISDRLNEALLNQAGTTAKTDFGGIRQQTALMGLISLVLNDINVSVTRLLVRLMEHERRSKEEIKEFIQGLINAYSAGDRDVFLYVLNHQLAKSPERINSLKSLSGKSPEISRDLSKVLREAKEIASLIQRVDEADIIGIVFYDGALRTLNEVLEPHFNLDGTAKASVSA